MENQQKIVRWRRRPEENMVAREQQQNLKKSSAKIYHAMLNITKLLFLLGFERTLGMEDLCLRCN